MHKIDVYSITGRHAISMQNGTRVRLVIDQAMADKEPIELDFKGVYFFAAPFLNAMLAGSAQEILRRVRFNNLISQGHSLLEHIARNAVEYENNKEAIDAVIGKMEF